MTTVALATTRERGDLPAHARGKDLSAVSVQVTAGGPGIVTED